MLTALRSDKGLLGKRGRWDFFGRAVVEVISAPSGRVLLFLSGCVKKQPKGKNEMKNNWKKLVVCLIVLCLIPALFACGEENKTSESPQTGQTETVTSKTEENSGLWKNATYLEDKEFGTGVKTVKVQVKVQDKSIVFTIHTDREFLGEALLDHQLVEGEAGQYGLYIKTVNGILADYDVDQSYWGFYQNGAYMMSGVDTTKISGGESYELVYTK